MRWGLGLALVVGVVLGGCRSDVTLAVLDGSVADAGNAGDPIPSRLGNGSRIPVDGSDWFLHGANIPWRVFGFDFGTATGAASSEAQVELSDAFMRAVEGDVGVVRWYMFVDSSIPFAEDAQGVPTGFEAQVFTDLQAAIDLAARFDVKLSMVLFGSIDGVLNRLADPEQLAGIAQAVEQLAAADTTGRIISWGIQLDPSVLDPAQWPAITHALGAAVRRGGNAYFTADVFDFTQARAVCADGADYVGFIEQGGLPRCGSCRTYSEVVSEVDPGCPIVVNVYFADASNAAGIMQSYLDGGYAGAFGWSLSPSRTTDGQVFQGAGAADFAASNAEAGPR